MILKTESLTAPKVNSLRLPYETILKDTLAIRLLRVMNNRGFNQVALARRSGLHHTTVSMVINNRRNITVETLVVIAKALEISTDYLLGLREDMK